MGTEYFFTLSAEQITVVVVDEWGPINTWRVATESTCLIVENGIAEARSDSIVCHSGPPHKMPVVNLNGAGWFSSVGDTGRAEIMLGEKCVADEQEWTLTQKT